MSDAPRHPHRPHRSASRAAPPRHLVYRRDGHVWLFRWDGGREHELIVALNNLAQNTPAGFDSVDASVVAHCLGETSSADSPPDNPSCS
jgi:hypothetical protein